MGGNGTNKIAIFSSCLSLFHGDVFDSIPRTGSSASCHSNPPWGFNCVLCLGNTFGARDIHSPHGGSAVTSLGDKIRCCARPFLSFLLNYIYLHIYLYIHLSPPATSSPCCCNTCYLSIPLIQPSSPLSHIRNHGKHTSRRSSQVRLRSRKNEEKSCCTKENR